MASASWTPRAPSPSRRPPPRLAIIGGRGHRPRARERLEPARLRGGASRSARRLPSRRRIGRSRSRPSGSFAARASTSALGKGSPAARPATRRYPCTSRMRREPTESRWTGSWSRSAAGPPPKSLDSTRPAIERDERGFIRVDELGRTSRENVWAVGDCTVGPMLAHRASEDGGRGRRAHRGRQEPDRPPHRAVG